MNGMFGMGLAFDNYVMETESLMDEACRLYNETDLTIEEIADELGFDDADIREFKRRILD